MISYIKGIITEVGDTSFTIECSGIGYEVFSTTQDLSDLSRALGTEKKIFTELIHREDAMILYGFLSDNTRKGFLSLQKVSGIGPKMAVKILSGYDESALFSAVENEDAGFLESIPGIGPKMAKKIIFELKGTIVKNKEALPVFERDLISAMINLGFKENDIIQKINDIKPLDDNIENNIKKLLKILAGR